MHFSTLNSSMLLELLYHPQFLCDIIFENIILANLVFCHATSMFEIWLRHFTVF
jgi:hypothetical protein